MLNQSILIYSFGVFSTRFKLKMSHSIYSGTIPDEYILDIFFAFADENKEVNVYFQYYNCLNLTTY